MKRDDPVVAAINQSAVQLRARRVASLADPNTPPLRRKPTKACPFRPVSSTEGQGADLLETRVWEGLSDRVIVASYSASRSFRTAAI